MDNITIHSVNSKKKKPNGPILGSEPLDHDFYNFCTEFHGDQNHKY